jgi:pyridoxamine 5'-phosphate oxidase
MTLQDCINFASRNPVCYLATADGNQPRVRAWLFWFGDPTGFYFQTLQPKDVFRQIKENPRVEFCFTNSGDFSSVKTMRLTGPVEILDDAKLKDRLFADMPFLKALGRSPRDPIHQIFRIAHGEVFFWTMADILKEKIIERITF